MIGDVLHPRTVDSAPHKHRVGGVEDARLGVRCGLSRRFNHAVKNTQTNDLRARRCIRQFPAEEHKEPRVEG
jgi:hypothetical protein